LKRKIPSTFAVAFDLKAPTFRHNKIRRLQGKQERNAEELRVQVPLLKEVLDAMNIKRLEMEGFEA